MSFDMLIGNNDKFSFEQYEQKLIEDKVAAQLSIEIYKDIIDKITKKPIGYHICNKWNNAPSLMIDCGENNIAEISMSHKDNKLLIICSKRHDFVVNYDAKCIDVINKIIDVIPYMKTDNK